MDELDEDSTIIGEHSASSTQPMELATQARADTSMKDDTSLTDNFRRSQTTGAGVRMLERLAARIPPEEPEPKRPRERSVDRNHAPQEEPEDRHAFLAERISIPLGTNKNRRKQMAGTNLVYDKCDAKTQAGLDKSRAKEWKKWMDFDAGVIVQGEALDDLMNEGYPTIPTQWIETDKNAHLIRQGKEHMHNPEYKSRMVACGHMEDSKGIRADSPTCATEGFNLICSFAACKKFRLKTGDLTNAYFTADPLDRLILMNPPRGGIPEMQGKGPYKIAANKPVYGTKDAGRRFYKTFRKRALEQGLVEARLCRSLYAYYKDTGKTELVILAGAHVDDIMWAADPTYEHIITEHLFKYFQLNHIHEGEFRFCGRDYKQGDDFSVYITCQNNIEKILPIKFERGTRGLDDKATASEISQARSVIGSMAWIARQSRPEFCYQTSRLQSVVTTSLVKHLIQCNHVLHDMQATATVGIYFKSGAFVFEEALLLSIHDASWANETKIIDHHIFPRRSQYGRINCLADPSLWDGEEGTIHFIGWKSGLIRKLCRSTFRAETQGCCYAMEAGVALRALITEIRGKKRRHDNNWEENCAQIMRHLWLTDCQSLHDHLTNASAAGCEDKRLEIDLEGLREYLWEYPDGTLKDYLTDDQHDKIRWIDTSAMICDPLTKAGPSVKGTEKFNQQLVQSMTTGILRLEASAESQLKKLSQQKARQAKALAKEQALDQVYELDEPDSKFIDMAMVTSHGYGTT